MIQPLSSHRPVLAAMRDPRHLVVGWLAAPVGRRDRIHVIAWHKLAMTCGQPLPGFSPISVLYFIVLFASQASPFAIWPVAHTVVRHGELAGRPPLFSCRPGLCELAASIAYPSIALSLSLALGEQVGLACREFYVS